MINCFSRILLDIRPCEEVGGIVFYGWEGTLFHLSFGLETVIMHENLGGG